MADIDDTLQPLRRRIDAIDDRMLDLLVERTEIVREIAKLKPGAEGGTSLAMRPGREAVIMRRLLARLSGPLPPKVVARLWREIFSAKTRLQAPMEVCVADAAPKFATWDLARFYYGSNTPMTACASPNQVIEAVRQKPTVIGIVPDDDAASGGDWWSRLGSAHGLYVVARLPFVDDGSSAAAAFVIAAMAPEASGDDISLGVCTLQSGSGDKALRAGAEAAGGTVLNHWKTAIPNASVLALAGFRPADDPVWAQMSGAEVTRAIFVGAYAVPMKAEASPSGAGS